jgi:hypothetical protein
MRSSSQRASPRPLFDLVPLFCCIFAAFFADVLVGFLDFYPPFARALTPMVDGLLVALFPSVAHSRSFIR